jgi:hypothetical protein
MPEMAARTFQFHLPPRNKSSSQVRFCKRLILPSVNGACMQVFVDEIAHRHPDENILRVVDGAGWHRSQSLNLPGNLQFLFLPP